MLQHTCHRRRNAVRLRLFTALSPVSQGFSHEYIKPPRCLACQVTNNNYNKIPMGHRSAEYVDSLDLIPSDPSPTVPDRSLPSTKNQTPPIPPPKDTTGGGRPTKEKKKKKKKNTTQGRRSSSIPALPRTRPKSSSAAPTVDRPKNPLAQHPTDSTTSLSHARPRPRPRPRAPKDSVVERDETEKKTSRRSTWVQSLDLNAFFGGISHEEDVGVPPLPPLPSSNNRRATVAGGGGGGTSRASFFSRSARPNPRDTFLDPDLAKPLPPPPSTSPSGKNAHDNDNGDLLKLRGAPRASRSSPRLSTFFSGHSRSRSRSNGRRRSSSALFGSGPPEDREAKERLLETNSSPPGSPGAGTRAAAASPKARRFEAVSAKEAYKDGGDKRSTCLWMKMDGNGKVSYSGMGMMGLGTL